MDHNLALREKINSLRSTAIADKASADYPAINNGSDNKSSIRIEMVCLGNICRSPLAAAVLSHHASEIATPRITVSSSGTANYHEGEGAHPHSQQVWEEVGYRYHHTARQFRRNLFAESDLILCMDLTNRAIIYNAAKSDEERSKIFMLRQFDPELMTIDPVSPEGAVLTVPDPWGRPIEAYREVRSMIERSVAGLLTLLTE